MTITIGIFVSFKLEAFELANKLITIAPEHCIAFERSLTKGRFGGIVDEWLLFHNRIVEEYPEIQAEAAIASMSLPLSNDFTGLLRHICLK